MRQRFSFTFSGILWLTLCLCGAVWSGCSGPEQLGSKASKPYLWESLPHHPQLTWHRHRADSAALYVRMPAFEPLHLRSGGNTPFGFSLDIELVVEPVEWPNQGEVERPPTVLHSFQWKEDADPERTDLIERITFPMSVGRYRIVHTIRDRHRESNVTGVTLFDGWSQDAPVRQLAVNLDTGDPAWEHTLPAGARGGWLVPADRLNLQLERAHLYPVDSFPSAPFLDRNRAPLTFPEFTQRQAPRRLTEQDAAMLPEGDWSGWGLVEWSAETGTHRWVVEGESRPWIAAVRRAHFPVMRDVDELIRATRFIATRSEYKAMRDARDPKLALDEFWLGLTEGPQSARRLIATYYGRVRDANVHFSSLKEGWSTDRGMVYVVFGHADRVRRDRAGETWIYGEEGDVNALVFRFTAVDRGDDFNAFELERYPGFRSPWEAMVSSWRRGKVRKR
ncbi:MAG: GWxTD domain-containing protein [Crocinitomicaceae bacterium TMED114]|nr:MAG: GWxTD domain-containing protein [Crocinitomicaceae bacterium TMED114]